MNLFKNRRSNRPDLDAELESHLQMSAADHQDHGASAQQASEAAHRELGNIPLIQQTTRDQRPFVSTFDDLAQDLRYAFRTLRKNPGFTVVAILTLALGIGANTAVFSVIDSVIFHPLPFAHSDRLVWLNGKFTLSDLADVSPPDFIDYRASNQSFERFAAMSNDPSPSNLSGDRSEQVLVSTVTANFFETLGITPILGRDFTQSDEPFNLPQVAILGHSIWMHSFGSDPSIVGKTIRVDGMGVTVVGVLPTDVPLLSEAQLWQPAPMLNQGMQFRRGHFLKVIGLRKSGVTQAQANAEMDAIADRQFTGRIEEISTIATSDFSAGWPIPRNFDLEISIDQADPRLKPGMTVQITVIVDRVPDSITIPAQASFIKSGQTVAYVWDGSAFLQRAIQVERRSRDRVLVSSGLKPGDLVALNDPLGKE